MHKGFEQLRLSRLSRATPAAQRQEGAPTGGRAYNSARQAQATLLPPLHSTPSAGVMKMGATFLPLALAAMVTLVASQQAPCVTSTSTAGCLVVVEVRKAVIGLGALLRCVACSRSAKAVRGLSWSLASGLLSQDRTIRICWPEHAVGACRACSQTLPAKASPRA